MNQHTSRNSTWWELWYK